jgi:hypothetical protein
MLPFNLPKQPVWLLIFFIFASHQETALSGDRTPGGIPTRYGIAAVLGYTFDPAADIRFIQASAFVMWDYDTVWRHWAPDPLRFKVEGTAGLTISPEFRAMASVGMLALYYLEFISSPRLSPYVEGGIGVIYSDFQVEGQGLRFNFNPQIGIGTEVQVISGAPFFTAIRLMHMSNSGLDSENRGMNSIVGMVGRFF